MDFGYFELTPVYNLRRLLDGRVSSAHAGYFLVVLITYLEVIHLFGVLAYIDECIRHKEH